MDEAKNSLPRGGTLAGLPTFGNELAARRKRREEAFFQAVDAFAHKRRIDAASKGELSESLKQVSPWIRARELRILSGDNPDRVLDDDPYIHPGTLENDKKSIKKGVLANIKAKEESAKDVAAMLYRWKGVKLSDLFQSPKKCLPRVDVKWSGLSRTDKNAARRALRNFATKVWAFREGRPLFPYTDLVHFYVKAIETAKGEPFSRQTNMSTDEKLSGVDLELLEAALLLALPAQGRDDNDYIGFRHEATIPSRSTLLRLALSRR